MTLEEVRKLRDFLSILLAAAKSHNFKLDVEIKEDLNKKPYLVICID